MKNASTTFFIACLVFLMTTGASGQRPAPRKEQSPGKAQSTANPGNVLERSRAAYAALRSYSDTGTITTEDVLPEAPAIIEHHTFTTSYRTPRQFLFDFKKDENVGDERFVIWSEGEAFNTWWSATDVHETYERGRGEFAFATASEPTKGSSVLIAPLLFSQANLQGPLVSLKEPKDAGTEDVSGHPCYKIMADMILSYSDSGQTAEERKVTLWIDTETLLVRKFFEDTPRGSLAGSVSRVTTVFEPQANPQIEDARFHFVPPSGG